MKTQSDIEGEIIQELMILKPWTAIDAIANITTFCLYSVTGNKDDANKLKNALFRDISRALDILHKEDETTKQTHS